MESESEMEEETGKGSESEVDTEESEETHWGSDESEEDPESLDSDECDELLGTLPQWDCDGREEGVSRRGGTHILGSSLELP